MDEKWIEIRREVDQFNEEEEINKVDYKNLLSYESVITKIKWHRSAVNLGSMGVYNLNRAIFTPRENARQKGFLGGMNAALIASKKILEGASDYNKSPKAVFDQIASIITQKRQSLTSDWDDDNEKKHKEIFQEMFLTSEISYYIYVWKLLTKTEKSE